MLIVEGLSDIHAPLDGSTADPLVLVISGLTSGSLTETDVALAASTDAGGRKTGI
jgi:hypothetical protein